MPCRSPAHLSPTLSQNQHSSKNQNIILDILRANISLHPDSPSRRRDLQETRWAWAGEAYPGATPGIKTGRGTEKLTQELLQGTRRGVGAKGYFFYRLTKYFEFATKLFPQPLQTKEQHIRKMPYVSNRGSYQKLANN